jgi:hypothetical protein
MQRLHPGGARAARSIANGIQRALPLLCGFAASAMLAFAVNGALTSRLSIQPGRSAHSYCAQSGGLVEVTVSSDGVVTYRPTGALVGSTMQACS